jgi:hypothetical protein
MMLPNIKCKENWKLKKELESFGKDYYKEIYENSLENIIKNPQILTSDQLLEIVEAGGGWVWALFPPRGKLNSVSTQQRNSDNWSQSWLKTLLTPTADDPLHHRKVPIYLMYLTAKVKSKEGYERRFKFLHADFVTHAVIQGPNFAEFINSKKPPTLHWGGTGRSTFKFGFRDYVKTPSLSSNPVFLSVELPVEFQFMNWASNPLEDSN